MAATTTTIHAHPLTRTTGSAVAGHYCDGCRATLTESYRCGPCNFDLCGPCFGKHKITQATRVHAHPLTYTTTGLDAHFCDVCSAATTRESWRCASCNFDCCASCFETIRAPKPAVAAPAEVKKAPLTVKQHPHPLTNTSGLVSHFCDTCKGPVTDSFRCAPCNWDLCATCFLKGSQQVTRLHAHPVTHTSTGLEGHFCDGCRAPTERESWRCAECNFDLCASCATRSAAPKTPAPAKAAPAAAAPPAAAPAPAKAAAAAAPAEVKLHPHALTRTTTGLSGHHCDICRASPLTVSYRCAPCNFDLCTECNERTHKQTLSLHPHPLSYTTGSTLDSHFCDGCRADLTGTAWRCASCNFDLCLACVARTKAPKPPAPRPAPDAKAEPVLTKAHQHALTATTGAELAGHHCDGCRTTGLTLSHRCAPCNFDLCTACFTRNRISHTSRMHAHPLAFTRGLRGNHCDDCRTSGITASWRCEQCDFDLCIVCFARAKLPKKAVEVKAAAPVAPEAKAEEKKCETHAVKGHSHRVELVSSGLTGHFCDQCRTSPLTRAFRCAPCNFDLCITCGESSKITQTSRVHAHPLKWTSGLSAHYCDVCRRPAAEAYRCTACNFDCCTSCLTTAAATAAAAPAKAAAPAAAGAAAAAAPAAAPAGFWPCKHCTYVNAADSPVCHVCSGHKDMVF